MQQGQQVVFEASGKFQVENVRNHHQRNEQIGIGRELRVDLTRVGELDRRVRVEGIGQLALSNPLHADDAAGLGVQQNETRGGARQKHGRFETECAKVAVEMDGIELGCYEDAGASVVGAR